MNEIIAKLFVSVMMVTDTGAISSSAIATDVPYSQCKRLAAEFTQSRDLQVQGHSVTIKAKAFCEPIAGGIADGRLPPPVAGMLNGFINGLAQPYRE